MHDVSTVSLPKRRRQFAQLGLFIDTVYTLYIWTFTTLLSLSLLAPPDPKPWDDDLPPSASTSSPSSEGSSPSSSTTPTTIRHIQSRYIRSLLFDLTQISVLPFLAK
jgi:hypothetical protein